MTELAERYARWKAPAADGQVLLWPGPDELIEQTNRNHASLSNQSSSIQNVPLAQVRSRMRQWLGHQDDQLLIATGHQAELHHPGVWAKNAMIDALASKLSGRAFHFAVDTDEPKHLALRWPGGGMPLTDDPAAAKAEWSGLVAPPTPAHLSAIERLFVEASSRWPFRPLIPRFLDSLRRLGLTSANLPSALTESVHQLDWDLGLRYDAMLVSPICWAEPYLLFVHHVIARADAFASDYNACLAEFRAENKIRSPGRPMPDLKCSDDRCEVPFWFDSLITGTRSRASVIKSAGQWAICLPDGQEFRFDPAADGWDAAGRLLLWLRACGLRLSPRALTLTAMLRMLVADQFVHGIGGGQYDQVLDRLIARHFRIEPPRFSVTTATLYFPGATDQPRVCLPCLLQEGHRLKHGALGAKKLELIAQIEQLPRRSAQRSQLFYQMHEKLADAWGAPSENAWEQSYRDAESRAQEERTIFDRELFYAIQPRERLMYLITRYREIIGGTGYQPVI